MKCAWKELLAILPQWMRADVDALGRESLREIRLRLTAGPELILAGKSHWLHRTVSVEDLQFVVNTASGYSPWAAESSSKGYITAPGGHRIGLCGDIVLKNDVVSGISMLTSLCIRVARDYQGIAKGISNQCGSVLILGPPGWGKTTLLRDTIRQISQHNCVSVVDERKELFPAGFLTGKRIDVLSGCPKPAGIGMLLQTMGPEYIAVDEITAHEDCQALIHANNCGVRLLATAHASCVRDLYSRNVYRPLIENSVFDVFLVLRQDQTFSMERMTQWVTNGLVQC